MLNLHFNAGDALAFDATSHYTQSGGIYTLYSDASLTTQVAKVVVS